MIYPTIYTITLEECAKLFDEIWPEDQNVMGWGIPWPNLRTYPHEHINPGDVMVLEAFQTET